MKKGFDNDLYLDIQGEKIEERIKCFDEKLYIEFGGKIFDDFHATRVLPGFSPDSKIKMLEKFKDDLEVIFCINANDIEKSKIRSDYGISYDIELLRLIDSLDKIGIKTNSVVITLFTTQKNITQFRELLSKKNIKTYIHTPTKGYPTDVETIVSEEGYGANPYIETTKKIVIVTAPGANSGKLATCLSQLYHEYKRGVKAGYAKFETFPVWNLPLKHPVNVAYEAATADLNDINMIDSFHLDAYGIRAVNYNRDLSTFPILKDILYKITGEHIYNSPTDMGINVINDCIIDDSIVSEASFQEIIRRYYNAKCDFKRGIVSEEVVSRIRLLMNELGINKLDRKVVTPALEKSEKEKKNVLSLELPNGKIITGKQTNLLSPASSLILNAMKELTNIPDEVFLLSPSVLEPILELKERTSLKPTSSFQLNLQEVLIVLSICSLTNPIVEQVLYNLDKLTGCECHASYMVEDGDLEVLKKLRINLTCEPVFLADTLI